MIFLPGHNCAHCAFLDKKNRILFGGDTLLYVCGIAGVSAPGMPYAEYGTVEALKEELEKLVNERDGLILGVCNGFQALIKLGLLPEGRITELKKDSPTLAMNTIGRHISKMVNLKVVSNKSPWLREAELGGIYVNPISHGEGRFVASEEWLDKLYANGQVATQYADAEGNPTMDEMWNPNGSAMAIEGITSEDGRIYGKMGHSERIGDGVFMNIYGQKDIKIFRSGVEYFK